MSKKIVWWLNKYKYDTRQQSSKKYWNSVVRRVEFLSQKKKKFFAPYIDDDADDAIE